MTELSIFFYFKATITVAAQDDGVIGFDRGMGSALRRAVSNGGGCWVGVWYITFAWAQAEVLPPPGATLWFKD